MLAHDFWSLSIITPHGLIDVKSHKVPTHQSKRMVSFTDGKAKLLP